MRSWKTPVLLATVGLCGLGSLFAQVPGLPPVSEPTPISSSDGVALPLTIGSDSELVAPVPVNESVEQVGTPVHEVAPAAVDGPVSGSGIEIHSVPAAAMENYSFGSAAPAVDPVVISSAPAFAGPAVSQPACACHSEGSFQGGAMMEGPVRGYGYSYAPPAPFGPIYTMGSGSGVAAGLLTPASNSGGLHTRYPYYNYRAPWFYQGPPSQNVTIVW